MKHDEADAPVADGELDRRPSTDEHTRSATDHPMLPVLVVVLFGVGYAATNAYMRRSAVADDFDGAQVEYRLWVVLLGAIVGYALAAAAYLAFWGPI